MVSTIVSRRVAWSASLSVLTTMAAVPVRAASERSAAELRRLAEDAAHRLDLQTTLPVPQESSSWHLQLPWWVLLAGLIAVLAILAYQFRDMVPVWRWSRRKSWEDASDRAGPDGMSPSADPLADADALAAQGQLVEAMHVLLLISIARIRRFLDEPFADSLTSREILRGSKLSDAGKTALRDLVMRVERFYFGEYPAQEADYEACRQRFGELMRALPEQQAA